MKKQRIVLAISIVLGVLIKVFLPAANGLTEDGVNLLTVFVPTIVLWTFCDTGWTSLLACVALAALNVMKGDTVFMTMYGNNVCVRIIALSIMASAMMDHGATRWIARWFISRKIVHGRPYMYIFLSAIVGLLMGFVVSAPLIVLMFADLNQSVAESIGYDRKSSFFKATTLISFYVATLGDAVSPFGRTISTTVIGVLNAFGLEVSPLAWLEQSIPFAIVSVILGMLVIKFFYKPDFSNFINYDDEAIRKDLKANPMSKPGKFVVFCVIVTLAIWVLPSLSFLPENVIASLNMMGTGMAVNLMLVVLCVVPINGEPVVDLGKAMSRVPWKLIVFVGAVIFFATYFGSDTYGIKAALLNVLSPVVADLPAFSLVIISIIFTGVATNFMSNNVTAAIVVSVMLPLLSGFAGVDERLLVSFAVVVALMADNALCCLAGSPTIGFCVNDDTVPFKEALPVGMVYTVCIMALSICFVFIYGYVL